MPIVRDGGIIQYANGLYRDDSDILVKKVGTKVRVTEGWNAGEIIVQDIQRVFLCHASLIKNPQSLDQKKEEQDYELALKCLYRVIEGKDTLENTAQRLTVPQQRLVIPFIRELLELPNGARRWQNTRDRIWWGCYREDQRWELLCIVKKKTMEKYTAYNYFYDDGMRRECIGRFLTIEKAKRMCSEKAHRRPRWIPNKKPASHENIIRR